MIILFFLYRACYSERDDARYYIFQDIWEEKTQAVVSGELEQLSYLKNKEQTINTRIYLKNCNLTIAEKNHVFHLKRLLVYVEGEQKLEPGNRLQLSGTLKEFLDATNPGQFDQRAYYKEKGIYYQMQAKEILLTNRHVKRWQSALYHLRDRMLCVYENCLPEKEQGIVSAMILGDKSLLDMDIRQLYQESGIGHLLAISGLHVTILGMTLYRLLRGNGVSRKIAVPIAVFVLVCYGRMTDYSISTSRAVLMMILFLIAEGIGQTYDRKSALAFSAICILLQKPFALFSCSFLLSFGAITGIEILLPVFTFWVFGDEQSRRESRRKKRQRNKELRANYHLGNVLVGLLEGWEKSISLFLVSLSVQMMTLPVTLYFFYEVPLYGIFINLFVIPLASLVVVLSFAGGLLGCILLPLGKLVLGSVYYLLQFYEMICRLFQRLPGHMQILGRPSPWKIVLYYGVLFAVAGIVWYLSQKRKISYTLSPKQKPVPWVCLLFSCLVLLFTPISAKEFRMTMLDVGQGDCLFLHTDSGQNFLVDGGSTSVSQVGTYRILPYLKSQGIRKIDYVFMTHSDEDHMNGLWELLKASEKSGFSVHHLIVPDVAKLGENGEILKTQAQEAQISVVSMSEGDVMQSGSLKLTCLNPVKDIAPTSANAGSITLSLEYGNFSCLLTGDLEGEGEQQVTHLLRQNREKYQLPQSYTVLKVAHHGSKNSTSKEFLQLLSPRLSLISCGKNNRYGHPHKELLERLEEVESDIYRTDERGAIDIKVSGEKVMMTWYGRQK